MINDELKYYLRSNPHWYLILSRYPGETVNLIKEYKIISKTTINDKLDKVNMLLKLFDMLM